MTAYYYPRTRRKTASSSRYWSRFICGGTHRWNACCWWTWFGSCKGSDAGTTSLTPEQSKEFAPRPSTFVAFYYSAKTRRWRKTCKGIEENAKQRQWSRHQLMSFWPLIPASSLLPNFKIVMERLHDERDSVSYRRKKRKGKKFSVIFRRRILNVPSFIYSSRFSTRQSHDAMGKKIRHSRQA